MQIPLLADKNCEIAKAYGVYKEDEGIAFRSGMVPGLLYRPSLNLYTGHKKNYGGSVSDVNGCTLSN